MDSVRFLRDSLLDDLGGAINRELGFAAAPRSLGLDSRERRRREALADYDVDQAGDPAAFVLRALLGRLRRAHVATLMYVPPINLQRLDRIGVRHELDLRRRAQALRAAVGAAAEEWLDLHATLGKKSFRDERNHLRERGCARVSTAVAQAIVARMSPRRS